MEDVSLVLEKLAPAQDDEVKTFADAFLTPGYKVLCEPRTEPSLWWTSPRVPVSVNVGAGCLRPLCVFSLCE